MKDYTMQTQDTMLAMKVETRENHTEELVVIVAHWLGLGTTLDSRKQTDTIKKVIHAPVYRHVQIGLKRRTIGFA